MNWQLRWLDRLPLAREWSARRAYVTLGILGAATLGTLLSRKSQGFPLLIVACAAFAVLMIMEARRPYLGRRIVVWTSVVLFTVAVLVPPRESEDVWSYAMYGHMVVHFHADPYRVPPLAFSGDPWFWRVSVWWQDTPTVYGPVFTGISAVGMGLAHNSALRARLFFQALTAVSMAGAMLLLYRRGAGSGALAFLGLSPVMVVNVVNGAHNDALVGLAALAAFLAISPSRGTHRIPAWGWALAGLVLGLGALVKLIALLPAGALVVWLWRREGRGVAIGLAAAVGAVVATGYLLVGGVSALAPLQDASRLVNHFSLWGLFGHPKPPSSLGQGPLGGLILSPVDKQWLTGPVRIAGTLLLAALLSLVVFASSADARPAAGPAIGSAMGPAMGMGASVLAFVLVTSYIQPWYLAAMLPVVAMQWRSRLAFLGAGYAIVLLLADGWLSSGGLVRTVLRLPLSTAFPLLQFLALAALVWLAVRRVRTKPLRPSPVPGGTSPALVVD